MIPIGKVTGKQTIMSVKMGDGNTPSSETFEVHQLIGESGVMLVFGPEDRWVVRMSDVVDGVIRFRAAMQRAMALKKEAAANETADRNRPEVSGPESKPLDLSDVDPRRMGGESANPGASGGDSGIGEPGPETGEETGPGTAESGEPGGRTAYPPHVV